LPEPMVSARGVVGACRFISIALFAYVVVHALMCGPCVKTDRGRHVIRNETAFNSCMCVLYDVLPVHGRTLARRIFVWH
jgi:hypothetical protein